MNTELEVRLLDIDVDDLVKKLEQLSAKFIGKWNQVRYIYDFNPFIENKWIRLRTDGIKTTLAIKEVRDTSITGTKELEIEVSSIEDTDKILEELGYKKRSVQENKRIRYILNGVEIDIDTWPHLKSYVEFEAKAEEDIIKAFEVLNLDYSKITTDDAQDIYLKQGYTLEDLNDLRFEEE